MASKLQKWGNSIGIRIPKSIVEKANIQVDSEVEIEHKDGKIIIFPKKNNLNLDDLLSKITRENLHGEENFSIEGKEIW